MDACTIDAQGLAQAWFGTAELGDRRRTKRLVATTQRILSHPGGSLPAKLGDPAALEGLYRLMDGPSVTHQTILTAATADTWRKMAEAGRHGVDHPRHDGVGFLTAARDRWLGAGWRRQGAGALRPQQPGGDGGPAGFGVGVAGSARAS